MTGAPCARTDLITRFRVPPVTVPVHVLHGSPDMATEPTTRGRRMQGSALCLLCPVGCEQNRQLVSRCISSSRHSALSYVAIPRFQDTASMYFCIISGINKKKKKKNNEPAGPGGLLFGSRSPGLSCDSGDRLVAIGSGITDTGHQAHRNRHHSNGTRSRDHSMSCTNRQLQEPSSDATLHSRLGTKVRHPALFKVPCLL